jgi:y4mF family transcriptional regulator
LSQESPDRFFLVQFAFECASIVPKGMIHMAIVSDSLALGQLIRTERKRQQLTQEQLAAVAGVGVRFVRELESGKESCRLGLALAVLQTLGLTVSVAARGANT